MAPRLVVVFGGSLSVLNPGDPGVDGALFSESSYPKKKKKTRRGVRSGRRRRAEGRGRGAYHLGGGAGEGSGRFGGVEAGGSKVGRSGC